MRSTLGVLASLVCVLAAAAASADRRFDQATDATPPATPAQPPRDFGFANGTSSVTVPFELINNHMYVQMKVNGYGPYRLLFDTGGVNTVTPEVAAEMGVSADKLRSVAGAQPDDISRLQVARVEIGDAFIDNQLFYVFSLDTFSEVEGIPGFGLVGYEIFKRFVVRVDYEASRITLIEPEHFTYSGAGIAVPFILDERVPLVEGEIDGIKGSFHIDAGSRSSLDLFAPFVEKHRLKAKYRPRFEGVSSWGTSGPSRSALARAEVLELGGVAIRRPVIELTLQTRGAFMSENGAGNVGAGILKRFNLVFDYGRKVIYFERNANDAKPDVFDRSGMWVNLSEDGKALYVVDVIAGGPAQQAGLAAGDHIVTVEGIEAGKLSLPELRKRFTTDAPGTRIRLEFERAGKVAGAEVILRDLL